MPSKSLSSNIKSQRAWWPATAVTLAVMLCVAQACVACVTHKWVGPAAGGSWDDNNNWSPAGPIATDDKVQFYSSAIPVLTSGSSALQVGQVDVLGDGTSVSLIRGWSDGPLSLGDVNVISAGAKLIVSAGGGPGAAAGIVMNTVSGAGNLDVQSINSLVPYVLFTGTVDFAGKLSTLCNGGSATQIQFSSNSPTPVTWKVGSLQQGTATQDGTCHTIITGGANLHVTGYAKLDLFAKLWADDSLVTFDSGVNLYAPAEVRAAGVVSGGVCNFASLGGALIQALGTAGVTCNGVTGRSDSDVAILSQGPNKGPLTLGSVTGGATVFLNGGSGASTADVNVGSAQLWIGQQSGTFTVSGALSTGTVTLGLNTPPHDDSSLTFTNPALTLGATTVSGAVNFAGAVTAASLDASAATSLTAAGDLIVTCGGAFVAPGPALHVAGSINAGTCPVVPTSPFTSNARAAPNNAAALAAAATMVVPAPAKAPAAAAPAAAAPAVPNATAPAAAAAAPSAANAAAVSRLAKMFNRPAPAAAAAAAPKA